MKPRKFNLSNKEKLNLLINSSNFWTTADIQKYFGVCYPVALKIKRNTQNKYGVVCGTKVSKANVLKFMNLDLEQEIKNLKITTGVAQ